MTKCKQESKKKVEMTQCESNGASKQIESNDNPLSEVTTIQWVHGLSGPGQHR